MIIRRRSVATTLSARLTGYAGVAALTPVVLLLLAACTSGAGASPAPSNTGVVSSGPLASPSGDPTAPNPVSPEPVKNARKQVFTKAEAVPGRSTVRVEGVLTPGPPCSVIGRADVDETATKVTITLWSGARPDADCAGPQQAIEFPFALDVQLKQPLGNRTIVDGAR